jgi:hypothetical protein
MQLMTLGLAEFHVAFLRFPCQSDLWGFEIILCYAPLGYTQFHTFLLHFLGQWLGLVQPYPCSFSNPCHFGRDAVTIGKYLPAFRRSTLPPCSGYSSHPEVGVCWLNSAENYRNYTRSRWCGMNLVLMWNDTDTVNRGNRRETLCQCHFFCHSPRSMSWDREFRCRELAEDSSLHQPCCENLQSRMAFVC